MDQTSEMASNVSIPVASTPSTTVKEQAKGPRVCKVCGDGAHYSYYGAVVCLSCKVFFKRNAQSQPVSFRCHDHQHCDININTRRLCSYCRLAKCFTVGMTTDMIRSSRTKPDKVHQKKKTTTTTAMNTTSRALVKVDQRIKVPKIRTLNLLECDISTLNIDQWNHLSNLVHCFDEYSGLSFIQTFITKQSSLPPKFRFKYSSVRDFLTSMMINVQRVFEKNRDFLSLSPHDRLTLLRSTVAYTTTIGGAFLLRLVKLFDRPDFSQTVEHILRPSTVALTKRLINHLDEDITFMKIIFPIIAFSISNYTLYTYTPERNLTSDKAIMDIQDRYTELVWRYLLYKHNYDDAILCFLNFVRCLFLVHGAVDQAFKAQQFEEMMDSVVQSTEQKLTLET